MNVSTNEVLMLLGEKDVLLYQRDKTIRELQAQVEALTPKKVPEDSPEADAED